MKNGKKIFTMFLASIMLATVVTMSAFAKPDNNGAEKTLFRAGIAPEVSGLEGWLWTDGTQIETPSGNVILVHTFFDVPEEYLPANTIINKGFYCQMWGAGGTYDSMCVSTPGGNCMLRAILHHNEP